MTVHDLILFHAHEMHMQKCCQFVAYLETNSATTAAGVLQNVVVRPVNLHRYKVTCPQNLYAYVYLMYMYWHSLPIYIVH